MRRPTSASAQVRPVLSLQVASSPTSLGVTTQYVNDYVVLINPVTNVPLLQLPQHYYYYYYYYRYY